MKLPQIVLGAFFTLGFLSPVDAADVAAGKVKAMFVCADCHGATGISVVANFPNLAGQKEMYLVAQLKAFRAGTRKNLEMNLIAKTLSEADIANVAAYFAGLPGAPGRKPR
jgi:cytochrome c553